MSLPLMLAGFCAAAGLIAAGRLRARSAWLRAWQRALNSMYAACAFARASSAQILRAGASDIPLLLAISKKVDYQGECAEKLFLAAGKDRRIRQEEQAVLQGVMRALSAGGREEIAAAIVYAQERFRQFCRESDRKRDADARLYMTLGLLSGICVFLILG